MRADCGMKDCERTALRKNSIALCKDLVVDEVLIQTLQADTILTDSLAEAILAEKTSQKRAWRLINLLPKRGPRAFSCFCAALEDTEQGHLSEMLVQSTREQGEQSERKGEIRIVSVLSKRQREMSPLKSDRDLEKLTGSPLQLPTQEEVPAKRARTHESMEMCLDADSPYTTAVQPCTAEFYHTHQQQAYRMCSSPRGAVLVVSNVTFDPALSDFETRRGGEVDEEVLRRLFMELDFRVSLHKDLTAQGMRDCIEEFSRRVGEFDCCAVCLLSHGMEGLVYGTDGQPLELDWVFEAFDNAHCPQLQNKPKMFFIQACRGEEMDCGVDQLDGSERTQSPGCEQRDAGREERSEREERERERLRVKLPQRSDMICGFATLKGTAAMRNTKKGSWYIQELNAALRQRAKDTHISDILVQVNGRIKEREGYAPGSAHHRCKEMSEFTSSLCKDLYLFPKYCPDS